MPRYAVAVMALAGLGLLAAAGYVGVVRAYPRSGWVHDAVVALLGPPARQLREAYAQKPGGIRVDHSLWDALLTEHVDDGGWVDYEAFRRDSDRLDAYLDVVARAPFDELGRDEKLALLINAYNAFTVELITEHLPLESIRDIPSGERWKARRWSLAGRLWSLNELEHDELRARFKEPRIHFVLVCGAAGCPPLARGAYRAERLEEQLERQARYVHSHRTWLAFDADANRLELTDLYSWYRGDFAQVAGTMLDYAARYEPRLRRALDAGCDIELRYLLYDWRLNSRAHRQPR